MPCQVHIASMIAILLLLLRPLVQLTTDQDWGPSVRYAYHLLDQQKIIEQVSFLEYLTSSQSLLSNYFACFL